MKRASVRWVAAVVAAVGTLPFAQVSASEHHAHYHYMIGVRANASKIHAAQLHHEASEPGPFHLEPARSNAAEMERMAGEIAHWVLETERVQTPEAARIVGSRLRKMEELARAMEGWAAELGEDIDRALSAGGRFTNGDGAELREHVASTAAGMFHAFHELLLLHKKAEEALGIPTPTEPPRRSEAG